MLFHRQDRSIVTFLQYLSDYLKYKATTLRINLCTIVSEHLLIQFSFIESQRRFTEEVQTFDENKINFKVKQTQTC